MISYLVSLAKSFKPFEFSPGDDFEPSIATRQYWRNTQKNPSQFGNTQLPGLFSTRNYPSQVIGFIVILILEATATYLGYNEGMLWEAVLGFILIDIFLAVAAHWRQDLICQEKNQLLIADQLVTQLNIQKKIERNERRMYFFNTLIGVSGLAKCYFFYITYLALDGLLLGVIACYLIGALLHILFTGYFLFTTRFNFLIWREYDEYISSTGKTYRTAAFLQRPINNGGIALTPASIGKNEIIKDANGNYFFKIYGILEDRELNKLIVAQGNDPITQGIIAREGLKLQLDQLTIGSDGGSTPPPNIN